MQKAKEILQGYVAQAEKILIELNFNEKSGLELLENLKKSLSEKKEISPDEKELYEACVYNALATINTCPNQEKKNDQLLRAITDAKEEMKMIIEFM